MLTVRMNVPALRPGDLFIYTFRLDADALEPLGLNLSEPELERAARFHFENDRRSYVIAHGRLREILAAQIGCTAETIAYQYGRYGKPSLSMVNEPALHFSLSRSRQWGAIAIQLEHEIGIDIEVARPFPDALQIAARLFTPEEHQALAAAPETERDFAFFRYWTRKEAIVKSLGLGLSQPLNSFGVSLHSLRDPLELAVEPDGRLVRRWLLDVPGPGADVLLAVASAAPIDALTRFHWPR
jgi:4'-phosphopantetheinyl transferase